jgi:hypothetical protein
MTFKSKKDSSEEETRTAYETKHSTPFGFWPIRMVRIGEFHSNAWISVYLWLSKSSIRIKVISDLMWGKINC